jgi:hypothetical protein
MPKPNPEAVAMLRDMLAAVEAGQLTEIFLLGRWPNGEYSYDFLVIDVPDLLYELGTVILTEREPRT